MPDDGKAAYTNTQRMENAHMYCSKYRDETPREHAESAIGFGTDDVPLPALDDAAWFDVEVAADIERGKWTRTAAGMLKSETIKTGCGKAGKIHPKSYAARFARMERAFERRLEEYERKRFATAPAAQTMHGADHSELRNGKAHPRSYRADLPLGPFEPAQLTRPTKEDKAAWAARPLVYVAARRPPEVVELNDRRTQELAAA